MRIYTIDQGKLDCASIELSTDGKSIIADDYRIVPSDEVVRIVDDKEPTPSREDILNWIRETNDLGKASNDYCSLWDLYCDSFNLDWETGEPI